MNDQSCPWPAAAALALGLALSGCAFGTPASGDTPSSVDRKKKDRKIKQAVAKKRKAPSTAAAKKKAAKVSAAPKPKPARKPKPKPRPNPKPALTQVWICSWAPTFDDDPYNDILCDNGIASERPRLREWDDRVQRWEMMESAREYALQRNAG